MFERISRAIIHPAKRHRNYLDSATQMEYLSRIENSAEAGFHQTRPLGEIGHAMEVPWLP